MGRGVAAAMGPLQGAAGFIRVMFHPPPPKKQELLKCIPIAYV